MRYDRLTHAASSTDSFVFHQLIPYIGNKRKLLGLIEEALALTGLDPRSTTFLDLFAGSGVVARFAKTLGYAVIANDWEPYAEPINRCMIEASRPPMFDGKTYTQMIDALNAVPDEEGWITRHLCPADDACYDVASERMFFQRQNGLRLDAIRGAIGRMEAEGRLDPIQKAALMAPLLYQACYVSNTSGVFKGFHCGWGGKTGTALYRIGTKLALKPAIFHDNGRVNSVYSLEASGLACELGLGGGQVGVVYIDPPYNQHPYGANYHVLNTLTLNDAPPLSEKIDGRNKAAIRDDWRLERRSAYNYKAEALRAYTDLIEQVPSQWILTSYSTDGTIPLREMIEANVAVGETRVVLQAYKRYRVSTQRYSEKPMNVEFILVTQKGVAGQKGDVQRLIDTIEQTEQLILESKTSVEPKKKRKKA